MFQLRFNEALRGVCPRARLRRAETQLNRSYARNQTGTGRSRTARKNLARSVRRNPRLKLVPFASREKTRRLRDGLAADCRRNEILRLQ